jgi:hypothetical protein
MYLRYLFENLPLCQSDEEMRALLPRRVGPVVVGLMDTQFWQCGS